MQFLTSLVLAAFVGYAGSWYLGFIEGNFALLLLLATVVTGIYWLAERFFFLPQRQKAVQQLEASGRNRLLVLSPAGLPCGTIERPELGEAVLAKLGLRLPAPMLEAARRQGTYPLGLALAQVVRSMVASGEASEEGPANASP